jgi:uncharacterized protein YkwD
MFTPMSALAVLPLLVLLAAPSTFEARVFAEIQELRKSPRAYAAKLRSYRKRFVGNMVKVEGRPDLRTHEGVSAVDSAIKDLQKVRSLPGLELSRGLSRAARDHALDLSRTGRVSHDGSDGSRPHQRIDRHGRWEGVVGENLSFANVPADEVVTLLLIDDGVPGRGHRKALLDPQFRVVGVACAPHRYGKVCVMDFAAGFKNR